MEIKSPLSIPNGQLAIIALDSIGVLGKKIDSSLVKCRKSMINGEEDVYLDAKDSYLIGSDTIRFSNGEGKVVLEDTVRGKDVYILCDVGNYGCTYKMFGRINHKSPDDHFQDIKRVLSAMGGKAKRITVVMPLLYASRQHRRKSRESLDCAMALQELERLGVDDIITFDVHDPNVQNAIPLISFDNLYPTYEIVKAFLTKEKDLPINKDNMLVISPDTGAMDRAIYYSGVLGLDIGLFYKRRDYSTVVNGKNPIIQHEYIGREVEGQNILIVDDMIASGESVFDIVRELKKRKAEKIFVSATFALFTEGIDKFDKYYEEGLIERVYSTNLTYIPEEVKTKPWFREVDMSHFIAEVINNLNLDESIAPLLDATESINKLRENRK
ncbi:MAG: ribose-phosphate pyrophosphokinase [Clostridium cadaveris]|uniref:ribose-phosphate diphosphokinase n=1 Tax=Clostridium cadaveris TaxID=1529 RepID=A0A1I2LBV2_9CLOT|nr:ribose-phosphate pyrophosphokinase [Clostridium cadaveris]MDM8311338.1 ribose-phosphate pyrophosphokinase [Clostridium cadaveris]MDU4951721.1 ribose-phosphate pyrophosphokinase [Clostridium sp.]MDY4949244.1 ribose-phosphate pyrophosphokinase [Clostridium cadaveris]SFF74957.1 ribose-phosphate pyrophosphokinase [Clostridium cadaveris]